MSPIVLPSPAKLNLFLAITGRRPDGFHELVSVATPLEWGDSLSASSAKEFALTCDDPAVPLDDTNLVMKAAKVFADATGWRGGAAFRLEKRIPIGAGLGGGSSNAASALRALNLLAGEPIDEAALAGLAARIGSDCPLFLGNGPVLMRGRGERIDPLPSSATSRLRGRRVLVFKPAFGVATAWAYARLAALANGSASGGAHAYMLPTEAARRVSDWVGRDSAPVDDLLFNQLEDVVFSKYAALPALLAELRAGFGVAAGMSGSGSACFALLPDGVPAGELKAAIHVAWGPESLVVETRIA